MKEVIASQIHSCNFWETVSELEVPVLIDMVDLSFWKLIGEFNEAESEIVSAK